ncbi:hypothetical protein B296_00030523 [Ensete ventricosum]|uniref:Cation-transporting P-type ATPase N-terminal domain-containing protein n=1 Tax=Ensete ventricosum TaxID=4639 RepID=A0A427AIY8_ENSVE|nr:hypothetical protein B296_00030523 [Ensete ventricosum]
MGKGGQDERKKGGWDPPTSIFPAWARTAQECEAEFKVSAEHGLRSDEVLKRRELYGLNELEKHSGPSIWQLVLEQFNDTLVRILLVAAVVSFVLAWYDGDEGGEMGITENNAEKALEALKEIQSEHAAVRRDGNLIPNLPAKDLLPGDIQASLTGENAAVNKTSHHVEHEDIDIQGKECMVFAGTTVVNIHEASQSEDDSPLKKKLNEFGEVLTAIIGVICALKCTYYFEIAVALAVAAIPEGLPAVITTCLALGTRKMAQKNALVRKLPSVETLGCTTVICSDKTGTLTTNQMSVVRLVADGNIYDWPASSMDVNLQMIAKIAAVCNDASITQSGHHFVTSGMPTEAALKVLVEKMGLPGGYDPSSLDSADILSMF